MSGTDVMVRPIKYICIIIEWNRLFLSFVCVVSVVSVVSVCELLNEILCIGVGVVMATKLLHYSHAQQTRTFNYHHTATGRRYTANERTTSMPKLIT